jgi:hypothetical protein
MPFCRTSHWHERWDFGATYLDNILFGWEATSAADRAGRNQYLVNKDDGTVSIDSQEGPPNVEIASEPVPRYGTSTNILVGALFLWRKGRQRQVARLPFDLVAFNE